MEISSFLTRNKNHFIVVLCLFLIFSCRKKVKDNENIAEETSVESSETEQPSGIPEQSETTQSGNIPSAVESSNVTIAEGSSPATIQVNVTGISNTSALCNSTFLSYKSSNHSLVGPVGGATWGGVWPDCTAVFSPVANANGSTAIEISATDGATSVSVKSFTYVINPVNDAPTIAPINSPQATNEDSAISVAFTADDVDGALTCTNANLQYSSDTASIVATSGATSWGGTWPNCTGTITPISNANGSANITFTLSDGLLTASRVFTLTVAATNDAPIISDVTNQSTNVNTDLSGIAVNISDLDSTLACTDITATSSNTTLIPSANVTILGTAPNCFVNLSPAIDQNGSSTITLTVSDGALTASDTFIFTVNVSVWTQEAYLKASNSGSSDVFGTSVALSGDTAVIGAYGESSPQTTITNGTTSSTNNSASVAGASYIYKRNGSIWSQEAYIKASNADASDRFGNAVTLSGDTAIIGAYYEDSNQTTITNGSTSSANNSADHAGAAYVYKRTGSAWAQEAYLKASNSNSSANFYATSVSLSGDMAVVGAYGEASLQTTITNGSTSSADNSAGYTGASYVYNRTGSTWVQEAYIKASNADATDFFGNAVGLAGDTAVVGAHYEDSNQTTITNGSTSSSDNSAGYAGAAYVYKRTGSAWAQEAYLKASNADASDYFGFSVAISGDTVVIGAQYEASNQTTITNGSTSSGNNSVDAAGAAYVYKRTGSTWAQEAYIKAYNVGADLYGTSVALAGDTAVIGAQYEASNQTTITNGSTSSADNSAAAAGAAYIYKRTGSTWAQEAYIKASNADDSDLFGYSVSLSGDTAVIGAYGEDSNQITITNGLGSSSNNSAAAAGAAYIYRNLSRMFDPDIRVSAKTTTSMTLSWGSNLGNATQVKVAPAVLGSVSPPACTDNASITLGAGVNSYTYSGLATATTYGFRICAFDGTKVSQGAIIRENTN